jgi:hypothetical protein
VIPEIYVRDDGELSAAALLTVWRQVCRSERRVAIGLLPDRFAGSSITTWEAHRGAVCVVGGTGDLDRVEDTDGLDLLDATPSRVRAARRNLGPERLLMASGRPRAEEVWEDVDDVDAWLVSASEADGSFPAIAWGAGFEEALRVADSVRGFAFRGSDLHDAGPRWLTDFYESVFHG